MVKKSSGAAFSVILALLIAGCSFGQMTDERIDDVARVFWHEGHRYSILVETGDNTYRTVSLPHYPCAWGTGAVSVVSDVPTNEKMWVELRVERGSNFSADCFEKIAIHVHSPKEVEGGGWNHGKFGTGTTSVIE